MKDYFHRYRFYEILKAAEKGEDLSQFVSKNPVESAFISSLTGGSAGGTSVPDYVLNHPFNNPNNTNFYYGMNLVGVKKIRVNLPKLAQAYAVLEGYNSAEELFNTVITVNYKNSKRFNHILTMKYIDFQLYSFDGNGVYEHHMDAYVNYGFSTSTNPRKTYLGAVYFGNEIVAGIEWLQGEQALTEYEILQQLGTVELDISAYTTGVDEYAHEVPAQYYIARIPALTNFGYRTDSNGNYIHFNLNEVTPDWIEFVY